MLENHFSNNAITKVIVGMTKNVFDEHLKFLFFFFLEKRIPENNLEVYLIQVVYS